LAELARRASEGLLLLLSALLRGPARLTLLLRSTCRQPHELCMNETTHGIRPVQQQCQHTKSLRLVESRRLACCIFSACCRQRVELQRREQNQKMN
jgi:hypothetical protein